MQMLRGTEGYHKVHSHLSSYIKEGGNISRLFSKMNMSILGFRNDNAKSNSVYNIKKRELIESTSIIEVDKIVRFTASTIITGLLSCPDNCYFDGKLTGDIEIKKKLVLGEHSEVLGNITAEELIVKGKVDGNMYVNDKMVICSTSTVTAANLQTNTLTVEHGAVLNLGCLTMQLNGKSPTIPSTINSDCGIIQKYRQADPEKKGVATTEIKTESTPDVPLSPANSDTKDTLLFQFFNNKEMKNDL